MLVINSVQREAVLTKYLGRKGLTLKGPGIFTVFDVGADTGM